MVVFNINIQQMIRSGLSVLCVVGGLLTLVTGCSSHQQTKVSSAMTSEDLQRSVEDLTYSDVEIAGLGGVLTEAPEDAHPLEGLSDHTHADESRDAMGMVGSSEKAGDPPGDSNPDSLGLQGDVYASSGQSASLDSLQKANLSPRSSLVRTNEKNTLPFALSDIFFDYDQYMLQEDDIRALETNAKILVARYPTKQLVIQGHCDERGTEEYNMVLGVRRAQAVKDYLVDLGVPQENLQVLSYGKEKPFCHQHSWNCWKHNRRSHFVFN